MRVDGVSLVKIHGNGKKTCQCRFIASIPVMRQNFKLLKFEHEFSSELNTTDFTLNQASVTERVDWFHILRVPMCICL